MADRIYRFKDKKQSDITKYLREYLGFSISSAKAFAHHMANAEQDNFTSEDLLKIAKKHNLSFGLSFVYSKDTVTEKKNNFKFPDTLDERQLEYGIWLNRQNFHTNTIPFQEMTTKEWEDYMFEEHHCSRHNAEQIGISMYKLLHGLYISHEKTPLHPL